MGPAQDRSLHMSGKSHTPTTSGATTAAAAPAPVVDTSGSNSAAVAAMADVGPVEDGSVGDFLTSINNHERLWAAEHSVPGYHELADKPGKSKKEKKDMFKMNKKVRAAVGSEVDGMMADGSVSAGDVRGTYQSSHDTGDDFGAELALDGVYGDEYVLHGHYGVDGVAKPGSMGVKKASDPKGPRIAHGVDDGLGGNPDELFSARVCDMMPSVVDEP
jgi:hypothetical protein